MARTKDPRFNGIRNCSYCIHRDHCTDAFVVDACNNYSCSIPKLVKRKRRKIQHIEDLELPKYVYE